VVLTTHPKPPHRRGDPDAPMIWAGPARGGIVDEREYIYKDLNDKSEGPSNVVRRRRPLEVVEQRDANRVPHEPGGEVAYRPQGGAHRAATVSQWGG